MMPRRRVTALVKPVLVAGFAVFVLGVTVVLPLLVHDDSYGEAPITRITRLPLLNSVSNERWIQIGTLPPPSMKVMSGLGGAGPSSICTMPLGRCRVIECTPTSARSSSVSAWSSLPLGLAISARVAICAAAIWSSK